MDYKEWAMLFPSLSWQCTFVNVVNSRKETDRTKIKKYSAGEYEEWVKWQKRAKTYNDINYKNQLEFKTMQIKKDEELLAIAAIRLAELQNRNKNKNN